MKHFITVFNAVGVLALVSVSVLQWRESGELRRRREQLNDEVSSLSKKLSSSETALASSVSTVEEFRKRNEILDSDNSKLSRSLRESRERLAIQEAELRRLENAVTVWKQAVAERDKLIGTLNDSLKEQVAARNEATQRHNELVRNYNLLAKRVGDAEKAAVSARAERDKAIAELQAALAVNNS